MEDDWEIIEKKPVIRLIDIPEIKDDGWEIIEWGNPIISSVIILKKPVIIYKNYYSFEKVSKKEKFKLAWTTSKIQEGTMYYTVHEIFFENADELRKELDKYILKKSGTSRSYSLSPLRLDDWMGQLVNKFLKYKNS